MTALVHSPEFERHNTGPGHPERPERCAAVLHALARLEDKLQRVVPRPAAREEILRCHSAAYFDLARREIASGAPMLSTGDTHICPASFDAARLAAGAAITAVDLVMEGKVARAFCVARPPGHHASRDRGMGFCIFNNAAIAARHAQQAHGAQRVVIVDWDVHHGNGTQDIFYADRSVFYFSTHQHPLYPGTGAAEETGAGANLNCPLPAGAGRAEVFAAFERQFLPAMDTFRPDLVIVSAGFDSRRGDPLGAFLLEDEDFADLTTLLRRLADTHAHGRIVSLLEGGYSLPGLASAAAAHLAALAS